MDDTLFQHYVEEKSNPVVGALEHHMYAGQFDWNTCYGCQGVRRYVKEALMGMIEVHSEVMSYLSPETSIYVKPRINSTLHYNTVQTFMLIFINKLVKSIL